MTKIDRLAFIKNRYAEKFGVKVSELFSVSKQEIEEETNKIPVEQDSVVDEEIAGMSSQIKSEKIKVAVDSDDEILLSKREKRELQREVERLRLANHYRVALVPAGYFG